MFIFVSISNVNLFMHSLDKLNEYDVQDTCELPCLYNVARFQC